MHWLRASVSLENNQGKFGMPQTLQRPRAVNAFHFRPGGSSTALTSSAARAGPNHVAQPDPQRRAVLARPVAHGASSQPGPSHPTAAARLAQTLGRTKRNFQAARCLVNFSPPASAQAGKSARKASSQILCALPNAYRHLRTPRIQ